MKRLIYVLMILVIAVCLNMPAAFAKSENQEQKLAKYPEAAEIINEIKAKQAEIKSLHEKLQSMKAGNEQKRGEKKKGREEKQKEREQREKERLAKLEELKQKNPEKYNQIMARMEQRKAEHQAKIEQRKKEHEANKADRPKLTKDERIAKIKGKNPEAAAIMERIQQLRQEIKELEAKLHALIKSKRAGEKGDKENGGKEKDNRGRGPRDE